MRPQEPSVPPYRSPGAGGEPSRADRRGPLGSDGPGGRAPSHARPDDDHAPDDPYGDVPAPPRTGGVQAPYGSSGWSGSDGHATAPQGHGAGPGGGYGPDDGRPGNGHGGPDGYRDGFGPTYGSPYGNGSAPGNGSGHGSSFGNGSGYGPAYGDGPGYGAAYGNGAGPGPGGNGHGSFSGVTFGAASPQGPAPAGRPGAPGIGDAATRAPAGPPWAAQPAPAPFGVPRPDGRPAGPVGPAGPSAPPAGGPGGSQGYAARPPAPGAAGGPGAGAPGAGPASGPPEPDGSPPDPAAPAPTTATTSATATAAGTAGTSATPSASPADDGGLAGSDGFASRPPRPSDSATTGSSETTTGSTRTTGGAATGPGRHRRGGGTGPDRDEDVPEGADEGAGSGPGRSGRRDDGDKAKGKDKGKKRKGSFWRELPLLIVVAVVLTFVIQTFLARIYVIPSASMERTLHGCAGCANDRVAVDKLTYRFSDPSPGDVVVFRGPPAWADNDEVSGGERSGNIVIRGVQSVLSGIGLAPPDEKDFVKRVIAVGGQTVACCDAQNRVTVDGRPLNEPYIYYQPDLGTTQDDFAPVRVPEGQLWVMGDNRNNSADARVHGPIGVTDVIGKARVIVLPVGRWGGVPDTDPQAQVAALGAPAWTSAAPLTAGVLGAVPLVGVSRRLRRRWAWRSGGGERGPDDPDPHADPHDGGPGEPPPSAHPGR